MQGFDALIDATPEKLLRRDNRAAMPDPKLPDAVPVLYAAENIEGCKPLPDAAYFLKPDAEHGLLYLPHPYLVPGGRFNEMYGWDTAFPVFAWANEHPDLMRQQVDNQLYQIRAYGKVLNANRTYYLSRSQPPMIAAMVLAVAKIAERAWLEKAYVDLSAYYAYWTTGDRVAPNGLSRYWDDADTPAIEVIKGEPGHYDHAIAFFTEEPHKRFYDGKLTPFYYRADRSMRASGLDPTGHWGYGALECIFHTPVCLNSLLFRMENDMAEIAGLLGKPQQEWLDRADKRLALMRQYMLDARSGIYHDYNFETQKRNTSPFATFFHALWAGIYDNDAENAKKAVPAVLEQLETPFGIATSTHESGSQWDWPNGWPPLQYFAFAGLKRCGMEADARRIAQKFVTLAQKVYKERHSLFEKYNVAEGSADTTTVHGYSENVSEGGTFLWTAATLKMAKDMLA